MTLICLYYTIRYGIFTCSPGANIILHRWHCDSEAALKGVKSEFSKSSSLPHVASTAGPTSYANNCSTMFPALARYENREHRFLSVLDARKDGRLKTKAE